MRLERKFHWILALPLLPLFAAIVHADPLDQLNFLKDVSVIKGQETLTFRLEFKNPPDKIPVPVFYKKSIQIDFPQAYTRPAKRNILAEDRLISQVYVVQRDPRTLRVRLVLGEEGRDLRSAVHVEKKGATVVVRVDKVQSDVLDKFLAKVSETEKREADTGKLARSADMVAVLDSLPEPEAKSAGPADSPIQEDNEAETSPKAQSVPVPQDPVHDALQVSASGVNEDKNGIAGNNIPAGQEKSRGFLNYSDPVAPEPPSMIAAGWKMFYTLAIVLGLMFALFHIFKRTVLKNSALLGGNDKLVKTLSVCYLAPKKMVALVEVAGEILALGISNDHITLLSRIRDEERTRRIKGLGQTNALEKLWKRNEGERAEEKEAMAEIGEEPKPRPAPAKADETSSQAGAFEKYIKHFAKSEPVQNQSVASVKELIRKNRAKIKTAI